MTERFFGEISGVPVGTVFPSREALGKAGVHRPPRGGISGTKADGAESIVVSGGYEDDCDSGDEIIYTGAGNRDETTGKQRADQLLERGNAALVTSELRALPVRVVRGSSGALAYSPSSGFRYDGLFRVVDHWSNEGKSGFTVWQFRLIRLDDDEAAPYKDEHDLPEGNQKPGRRRGTTQRVVRSTVISDSVKKIYRDHCQVCDTALSVPGGSVSEGAHIRGLGRPHDGPDVVENVLCLCPNHHTLLDKGGIYIDDDFTVWSHEGDNLGQLTLVEPHIPSLANLAYHRTKRNAV